MQNQAGLQCASRVPAPCFPFPSLLHQDSSSVRQPLPLIGIKSLLGAAHRCTKMQNVVQVLRYIQFKYCNFFLLLYPYTCLSFWGKTLLAALASPAMASARVPRFGMLQIFHPAPARADRRLAARAPQEGFNSTSARCSDPFGHEPVWDGEELG